VLEKVFEVVLRVHAGRVVLVKHLALNANDVQERFSATWSETRFGTNVRQRIVRSNHHYSSKMIILLVRTFDLTKIN
jgi:hypothetical protein